MQQLHGKGRESERQPATIRDSERHAGTLWDRRESDRKPATILDSKRHTATPLERRDIERTLKEICSKLHGKRDTAITHRKK